MQSSVALAFDFDGVILDSEAMKMHAFMTVFASYLHAIEDISAYNAQHRGVPRRDKIRYICEHMLEVADCDVLVETLLQKYALALQVGLAHSTLMPGILLFLEQTSFPKFICSSAPQHEVANVARSHSIDHHFMQILGYPTTKAYALRSLKHAYQTVIFFGDAVADYQAAQAAGAVFFGVVSATTRDRFRGLDIPLVEQWTDGTSVMRTIAQMIKQEA